MCVHAGGVKGPPGVDDTSPAAATVGRRFGSNPFYPCEKSEERSALLQKRHVGVDGGLLAADGLVGTRGPKLLTEHVQL